MKKLTAASLLSGGGLADFGLREAGVKILWGVEKDAAIATLHHLNFPEAKLLISPVEEVDYSQLETPDLLHASPSCLNFSNANKEREEKRSDIAIAKAIEKALSQLKPQYFTLENSSNYTKSASYQLIYKALYRLGYWLEEDNQLNFADYGSPSMRKRLFLIAYRDGKRIVLPPLQPRKGWYDAIKDLTPTFTKTELTKTQCDRLLSKGMSEYLEPNLKKELEPILIKRIQIRQNFATPKPTDPAFTMTAKITTDGRFNKQGFPRNRNNFINYVDNSGVYAITTRAMARLQSVSDSYNLTSKNGVDGLGIGNGVPPIFMKDLINSNFAV